MFSIFGSRKKTRRVKGVVKNPKKTKKQMKRKGKKRTIASPSVMYTISTF